MIKNRLFAPGIIILLLIITSLVIFYARGYRIDLGSGKASFFGTGILVATSTPNGASVYINNHLTTATDNTVNLTPGEYSVKIFKDGYLPWEKKLKIEKEVVTSADALLFPTAPKLESITNTGVKYASLDPSKTRLAFSVASQSARKNGIYVLDLSTRPILTLQSSSNQIVDDTTDNFSNSTFSWSPDGTELIATTSAKTIYILNANQFNDQPQDVTATLPSVSSDWQKQKEDRDKARLETLPRNLREMITSNFKILEWSLDDSKILYEASKSASLPIIINPRLIGFDTTKEDRNLVQGQVYVYDIKEDKNYEISLKQVDNLHWFPDSKHLIYVNNQKIDIMEIDGDNRTTIYAGPFVDNFVFPWSDGSKIVILTNLGNPDISPNLYTISLK